MATILVTGATGLIGSNVCAQALAAGHSPRALARAGSRTGELVGLGAEVATGDITRAEDVRRAAEGCEYCIHTAALVVGGPPHPFEDYHAVNVAGTANVLAAARAAGLRRTVVLSSSAAFDRTRTLTETTWALTAADDGDPYAITKRDAFKLTLAAIEAGLDAVVLLPGGAFGPAPTLERALEAPGFNSRLVLTLQRKIDQFPPGRVSFVLAEDVARTCVAALERGVAGELYLAWGRPEQVSDGVTLFNLAAAAAGLDQRVKRLTDTDLDRPEVLARWGPAILRTARAGPDPLFDNPLTRSRLGHDPLPLEAAAERTVSWLVANRLVPGFDAKTPGGE